MSASGYSTPEFVLVTPPPSPAGEAGLRRRKKPSAVNVNELSTDSKVSYSDGLGSPQTITLPTVTTTVETVEESSTSSSSTSSEESSDVVAEAIAALNAESSLREPEVTVTFPSRAKMSKTPPPPLATTTATTITTATTTITAPVKPSNRTSQTVNLSQLPTSNGQSLAPRASSTAAAPTRREQGVFYTMVPPPYPTNGATATIVTEPVIVNPIPVVKPKKGIVDCLTDAKIILFNTKGSVQFKAGFLLRALLTAMQVAFDRITGFVSSSAHAAITLTVKCLAFLVISFVVCIAAMVWVGVMFAVSASYGAFWATAARWWFAPDVHEAELRISFDSTAAVREQWRWAELEQQTLGALEQTSYTLEKLFAEKEERHRARVLKIISDLLPGEVAAATETQQLARFLEREDGLNRRLKGRPDALAQALSSDDEHGLDTTIVTVASNELKANTKTRRSLLQSKWGSMVGTSTVWLSEESGGIGGFLFPLPSLRPQQYILTNGVAYDIKLSISASVTTIVDPTVTRAIQRRAALIQAVQRAKQQQNMISSFVFGPSPSVLEMEDEIARGLEVHNGDMHLSVPMTLEASLFDRTNPRNALSTATISTMLDVDVGESISNGGKPNSRKPPSSITESLISSVMSSLSPSNLFSLMWSAFTLPLRLTSLAIHTSYQIGVFFFNQFINAMMWVCFGWARVTVWFWRTVYQFIFESFLVVPPLPEQRSISGSPSNPDLASSLTSASLSKTPLQYTSQSTEWVSFSIADNFVVTRGLLDQMAGMNLTLFRKISPVERDLSMSSNQDVPSGSSGTGSPQVTDVTVTGATIKFTPYVRGISYYFYHYPIISFGVVSLMNGAVCFAAMSILSVVVAFALFTMLTKQPEGDATMI